MKRILSKKEEQAFRLCHQDWEGMTTRDAAVAIGLSQRRVQQLLQSVEQKAPALFPILTKCQMVVRDCINENGFTFKQIAEVLCVSESNVDNIVKTLKKKGVILERRKPTVQYQDYMDNQVKERF